MSTLLDLETDLSAAIEALASTPTRYASDRNDSQGQRMTPDQWYYRLRLVILEETPIDSNQSVPAVQASIDMMVLMAATPLNPRNEAAYVGQYGPDQRQLVDPDFYLALSSVLDVPVDSVPQVIEGVERNGNVLVYQVAANVVLTP